MYGPFRQEFPEAEEETEENGCQVIVSLGGWPDRLQEKDIQGMLTEFYGGMYLHEALLQAYEDMNKKTGKIWIMGEENAFPEGASH